MGVDMLLLDSQSVKKFCNESLPKDREPLDTTACENPSMLYRLESFSPASDELSLTSH
ncbi:hypothetical protein Bca4012_009811 [Brassica carinata]|uniref:Uncharacterized protein n=1 Tax=Brassica carinata TaxID=52824 RepID=A0A8X7S2P0_BRACI|nr:hypothetical protein Bca52824_035044 [Brassica carinata]